MSSKSWIKFTVNESGLKQIEGGCEICRCFPCYHTERYWNDKIEKFWKEEVK